MILSISSFLFSIWAISSAVTVTGVTSAIGGDLPESTVELGEDEASMQEDAELLGQNVDQETCVGLPQTSWVLEKTNPSPDCEWEVWIFP